MYFGLSLLLVTVPCGAATYTVDDDGPADYDKIQYAINAAEDGDTVLVMEGHYFENIDFRGKAITVSSTDPTNPSWLVSLAGQGADTQAVLMSVYRTLKQRGHHPIDTVVKAIESYLPTGNLPPLPAKTPAGG